MSTALRARTGILASLLVSGLLLSGCGIFGGTDDPPAGSTTGNSESSDQANLENTSNPRRTGAARFLPDLSDAPFKVNEVDLSPNDDPLGAAASLIDLAVGDPDAPRDEVNGVQASTVALQIRETTELATTAMNCLGRKGHLAMHAYTDTHHRYSTAIAFVVNPRSYRDADVTRCAISSDVPYDGAEDPAPPSIAPCVGQRRQAKALITWVATTDAMCAVLGDPVAPVERALGQGSFGTDVARLQLALNDVGNTLTVDGRLGRSTVLALQQFQNCYGIIPERAGVADLATLNAVSTAQSSGWSPLVCGP